MDDRFLKTGVFLAPFHPLDENPLLALDRDMELLVHLDRLNYHEAWIGEHHSGGFEIIACPELFIAGAAERTRHIRLGTGVVSLPYHNPFTLAGRMMQLDYMTRGRAMFGVGPGSLVYDAVKMGLNPQDQRRKLDEALDVIVELMQGRAVTKKTDWFDLHEARLQLKSYSQPMMEMAVASNRSPVGAVAAGKHNIGMLSIGGTSDEALKAACHQLERLRGKRAGGRQDAGPPQMADRYLRACGGNAGPGAGGRQIRPGKLQTLFQRSGDVPHHPARYYGGLGRVSGCIGSCLYRHAGGLRAPFRAIVARLERRVRRRFAARA
jgi:Luciferase-like monooxygenase